MEHSADVEPIKSKGLPWPKQTRIHNSDSASWSPWSRKMLLTLDGGGIRGYSSLLVLRELLSIVRGIETGRVWHSGKADEALSDWDFLNCSDSGSYPWSSSAPSVEVPSHSSEGVLGGLESASTKDFASKPTSKSTLAGFKVHHYFDYVAGTSTGGLSAIMLSRMKLSIDEALAQYDVVGNKVFGNPRPVHLDGKLLSKYRPQDMKKAVLSIIEARLGDERTRTQLRSKTIPLRNENPEACQTMVIAHGHNLATPRDAYMFRSYDHPFTPRKGKDTLGKTGVHLNAGPAHTARLWEVAQATSAAPGYFSKVKVEGRAFRDGGLGSNNPASHAFSEVLQMHGMRPPAIVLSIGTGAPPRAETDRDPDHVNDPRRRYWLFNHMRDMLDVVDNLKDLATHSHDIHLDVQKEVTSTNNTLAQKRERGDPGSEDVLYYRFDAPDISEIKLDEWDPRTGGSVTKEKLRRATVDSYLQNKEVRQQLVECATKLVEIRQRRSATERWEQFATQTTYTCPEQERCYSIVFPSRDRLRQHSFEAHGIIWPVTLDQSHYVDPLDPHARLRDDQHLLCIWDECGQCPTAFANEDALTQHLRIKHGKGGISDPTMLSWAGLEEWLDRGRSAPESGCAGQEHEPTQDQEQAPTQSPRDEVQAQARTKPLGFWSRARWARRRRTSVGKQAALQEMELA